MDACRHNQEELGPRGQFAVLPVAGGDQIRFGYAFVPL